jgi:hypothetical protein
MPHDPRLVKDEDKIEQLRSTISVRRACLWGRELTLEVSGSVQVGGNGGEICSSAQPVEERQDCRSSTFSQ